MAKSAAQRRRVEPRKPTRRLPRADRKRQLLIHAKQLFLTLGYHATTTEKIAEAAGVTEPVLYQHFDDKKALFLEVLRDIRETTLVRWQEEVARRADPLAKLQAIAGVYLGSTRDYAPEFRVLHRSLVETQDADIAAFLLGLRNPSGTNDRGGTASPPLPRRSRSARRRLGVDSHRPGLHFDAASRNSSLRRAGLRRPRHRLPVGMFAVQVSICTSEPEA